MPDVFELEPATTISKDDSYLVSYPHLLSFFASTTTLTAEHVVCGAHMVYGWMPTILDLYLNKTNIDLSTAAGYLNVARDTGNLADSQLKHLVCLINNSLVGVSKLLHFTSPQHFAIWDSKVYAFVFQEKPHPYRVNDISKYRSYLELLRQLQQDQRFPEYQASVCNKIGYEVSPLRSLELIMYLNSPTF